MSKFSFSRYDEQETIGFPDYGNTKLTTGDIVTTGANNALTKVTTAVATPYYMIAEDVDSTDTEMIAITAASGNASVTANSLFTIGTDGTMSTTIPLGTDVGKIYKLAATVNSTATSAKVYAKTNKVPTFNTANVVYKITESTPLAGIADGSCVPGNLYTINSATNTITSTTTSGCARIRKVLKKNLNGTIEVEFTME